MSRRAKTYILGGGFLLAALLPFALLTVPNPPQFRQVETVEDRGVYLENGGHLYRLYPHPKPAGDFPGDALVTGMNPVLLVNSRQYDALEKYSVRTFGEGTSISLNRYVDQGQLLRVAPSDPLPPGEYEFHSVEDSLYGGDEYYYFTVSGP